MRLQHLFYNLKVYEYNLHLLDDHSHKELIDLIKYR